MALMESQIEKIDLEQRVVFGWASVADIEDSQGDIISIDEIEKAAYSFALDFGESNTMHAGPATGRLVESFVTAPEKLAKMGVPEGTVKPGWWIGFKIDDDDAWQGVKSGRLKAFSIEGAGERTPVTE